MRYENPTEHKGFTVSAYAVQDASGTWQGSFVITKDGESVYRITNSASFDSQDEAEQQAISLGCRLVNGEIPANRE